MQKFLASITLIALSGSQVFGDPEPSPRDDGNANGREIVPLDQIQTKPWQPSESYPTYAADPAPYPYPYFGGYPQAGQMIQPRMMVPQAFQPQPFPQVYQPQPYPYPMQQQFQQPSWQPTPGNYGPVAIMDNLPQPESGSSEPTSPVETPISSQIWAQPPSAWGSPNGVPTWKRAYTPLPGQSGCFNRCRPSCNPYSCQSSCQSACNIRPTCGRRGQVSYNGSTMICGRPGFNQGGLWPEVNPWQDYQNPWEQRGSQNTFNMNGLQASSMTKANNNEEGVEVAK